MKKAILFILAALVTLSMAGTTMAATNLKLAHVVNEKDTFQLTATKFKELVEERTGGDVKVTIFPNAKLGDERTLLERMKLGVVDAGVITTGPLINFIPQFGVVDLPFLFSGPDHAYRVLDGNVGKQLMAAMEPQGWKGLAFAERGFRNLTNSKHPVTTPDDVKGLKIRLMQNPVYVDSFKALGANAVPMAWTEVLTALQQGTVDGQENPLNVIVSFKLYETQKHMTLSRHAYAPAIIMMSKKSWDKLTDGQQQIVQQAAQEAAEFERAYDNQKEAEWLQFLKDQGMEVVETPDLAAFREAVKPVYEKYQDQFGKDLIEQIQQVQ